MAPRCFIKPTIHSGIDDIGFGGTRVPLTCLDQPIPSTPRMKDFETLDVFDKRSYLSSTRTATELYLSSDIFNEHVNISMAASVVSKFSGNRKDLSTVVKCNCHKFFLDHGRTFYRAT